MKKNNLLLVLMAIFVIGMTVAVTACGKDDGDVPGNGDDNGYSSEMYAKLCDPLWGSFANSRMSFLSFSTDGTVMESFNRQEHYGTWSFQDNSYNTIEIYGNLTITEYLGESRLNLSFSGRDMTLYAPGTGKSMTFTDYSGGSGGSGGGGGNESDERVSTEVLCITVITSDGSKSVSDEVYHWYRGTYGSAPALYRSRSASDSDYVLLGRRNTDSTREGYRVSGFDYMATESPLLHTMKYYYFD